MPSGLGPAAELWGTDAEGARGEGARRAPLHAAVAWCGDPDGVLAANLARLGATHVLVVPSRPLVGAHGVRPPTHIAEYLVSTLQPLGVDPSNANLPIRVEIPEAIARAAAHPDVYPFFDDAVAAQIPDFGPVDFTLKAYARYADRLRLASEWL